MGLQLDDIIELSQTFLNYSYSSLGGDKLEHFSGAVYMLIEMSTTKYYKMSHKNKNNNNDNNQKQSQMNGMSPYRSLTGINNSSLIFVAALW